MRQNRNKNATAALIASAVVRTEKSVLVVTAASAGMMKNAAAAKEITAAKRQAEKMTAIAMMTAIVPVERINYSRACSGRYSSLARLPNCAYSPFQNNWTIPVEPWRCLPIITSAMFLVRRSLASHSLMRA